MQIAIQFLLFLSNIRLLKANYIKNFHSWVNLKTYLILRLLKANYIKEFSFLSQSEDPLDIKKCYLDLNSLQAREESAIRWVIVKGVFFFPLNFTLMYQYVSNL